MLTHFVDKWIEECMLAAEDDAAAAENDQHWSCTMIYQLPITNYQLPHYKLIKIYSYKYQMLTPLKPQHQTNVELSLSQQQQADVVVYSPIQF